MAEITITEALAEIPTIMKRIEKKQQVIKNFLYRQVNLRDPHEKSGGSAVLIKEQLQGIHDLEKRLIAIRLEIQKANQTNTITIGETTKPIADWLTWRRELAGNSQRFYAQLTAQLQQVRNQAMSRGLTVTDKDTGVASLDFVVNVDEKWLGEQIENLEEILGVLDGQLSLKNATITIDVP